MIEGNLNLYKVFSKKPLIFNEFLNISLKTKRRRLLTEDEKAILEETFRDTMHPNKPKLHEL